MYGIDEKGIHHSGWAFTDVDDAPSKSFLIENYKDPVIHPYFCMAYDKRPEFELYNVNDDPFCLHNLAGKVMYQSKKNSKQLCKMKWSVQVILV